MSFCKNILLFLALVFTVVGNPTHVSEHRQSYQYERTSETNGHPGHSYVWSGQNCKTNCELSSWAKSHREQVISMAEKMKEQYNLLAHGQSNQYTTSDKYISRFSHDYPDFVGKSQHELDILAKELTEKMMEDMRNGILPYSQVSQPLWFERQAAEKLEELSNLQQSQSYVASQSVDSDKEVHNAYESNKLATANQYQRPDIRCVNFQIAQTRTQDGRISQENIYRPCYSAPSTTSSEYTQKSYNSERYNQAQQPVQAIYPNRDSYNNQNSYTHGHELNIEKQENDYIQHKLPVTYSQTYNSVASNQNENTERTSFSQTQYANDYQKRVPIVYPTDSNSYIASFESTREKDRKYYQPSTISSSSHHSIYGHLEKESSVVPNYRPHVVMDEKTIETLNKQMEKHQPHVISTVIHGDNLQANQNFEKSSERTLTTSEISHQKTDEQKLQQHIKVPEFTFTSHAQENSDEMRYHNQQAHSQQRENCDENLNQRKISVIDSQQNQFASSTSITDFTKDAHKTIPIKTEDRFEVKEYQGETRQNVEKDYRVSYPDIHQSTVSVESSKILEENRNNLQQRRIQQGYIDNQNEILMSINSQNVGKNQETQTEISEEVRRRHEYNYNGRHEYESYPDSNDANIEEQIIVEGTNSMRNDTTNKIEEVDRQIDQWLRRREQIERRREEQRIREDAEQKSYYLEDSQLGFDGAKQIDETFEKVDAYKLGINDGDENHQSESEKQNKRIHYESSFIPAIAKLPATIISEDRGDQPPQQYKEDYDFEESEPGIGPYGIEPQLATSTPPEQIREKYMEEYDLMESEPGIGSYKVGQIDSESAFAKESGQQQSYYQQQAVRSHITPKIVAESHNIAVSSGGASGVKESNANNHHTESDYRHSATSHYEHSAQHKETQRSFSHNRREEGKHYYSGGHVRQYRNSRQVSETSIRGQEGDGLRSKIVGIGQQENDDLQQRQVKLGINEDFVQQQQQENTQFQNFGLFEDDLQQRQIQIGEDEDLTQQQQRMSAQFKNDGQDEDDLQQRQMQIGQIGDLNQQQGMNSQFKNDGKDEDDLQQRQIEIGLVKDVTQQQKVEKIQKNFAEEKIDAEVQVITAVPVLEETDSSSKPGLWTKIKNKAKDIFG